MQEYLSECVKSVLDQSFTDFELILVDDGSTDHSGMFCDRYALKDTRIIVLHQKNSGASAARNNGIDNAKGEYVIFLDADDYWISSDVLQILSSRLDETNPDVLIYNFQKQYNAYIDLPYFSCADMPFKHMEKQSADYVKKNELWTACPWNKAIKLGLFKNNSLHFREGITSEDIDWCLRLAISSRRFDYIDLCVVAYRQREGSVTSNVTVQKTRCLWENVLECLRLCRDFENQQPFFLKAYVAYSYGTLLLNISALPRSKEKSQLCREVKPLLYILEWSKNRKIRLLNTVRKCVGFNILMRLLYVKSSMRKGS